MDSNAREARRNEKGVSLKEAIEALRCINSTAPFVAWEMADWIYRNWTLEQVQRLPESEREAVMQYVERNVREYIDDGIGHLSVKAVRKKRLQERKAAEQMKKLAIKNQLPLIEAFDKADAVNAPSEASLSWRSVAARRLRTVLLFLGFFRWG
ncbi:MAG: hypothetical protein IT470_08225 [Pseudomonadales bacterium]|nr:hypothetical protein [Pseudomonadales bacterium]